MNTSVCGYISAKAKRNLDLLIIMIFTCIKTHAQFISNTFHRIEPDSKLCWQEITDFISGTADRNRPTKKTAKYYFDLIGKEYMSLNSFYSCSFVITQKYQLNEVVS